MPRYEQVSTIERADGILRGELRAPVNFAAMVKGGIHDDDQARRLGFGGGLVSGLIHNEQFMPLALNVFGPQWFERGSYSFYYPTPTLHLEPVQAFLRHPGDRTEDVQVDAWSVTEDGRRVAEGTVAMGNPGEPSALRRRLQRPSAPGDLRILANVRPGMSLGERPRRFPFVPLSGREGQLARRDTTTEPLDWYFGPSPWGPPIAGSFALYRLLRPSLAAAGVDAATTLDGGIEVRFINGPAFLDTDYILSGRILHAGQSPRTEYLWFESSLRDPARDLVVAEMLMMARWMKNSSPLYAEG